MSNKYNLAYHLSMGHVYRPVTHLLTEASYKLGVKEVPLGTSRTGAAMQRLVAFTPISRPNCSNGPGDPLASEILVLASVIRSA